jgi:hypothetical protein
MMGPNSADMSDTLRHSGRRSEDRLGLSPPAAQALSAHHARMRSWTHHPAAHPRALTLPQDLVRLIPLYEHAAFREMLAYELRGRDLPHSEMRRIAERTWRAFCKYGWPRVTYWNLLSMPSLRMR